MVLYILACKNNLPVVNKVKYVFNFTIKNTGIRGCLMGKKNIKKKYLTQSDYYYACFLVQT